MNELSPQSPSTLPRLFGRMRTDHPFALMQQEAERMFDQFGRMFGEGGWRGQVALPSVDITDTGKGLQVTAELPGLSEEDIDVTVQDGVLTLRGEKKQEKTEKDANRYVAERHYGAFLRSFALPAGIDENGIQAAFDKGVLRITLPKLPEAAAKVRKIAIAKA
jgi:HSP20 family protein